MAASSGPADDSGWTAGGIASDTAWLLGLAFGIPFLILAIGMPVVLLVRLIAWLTGLL